ncbi:MAG: hypothetical protein KDC35_09270 [Acidobacteria bacterium]|nr:hypothetical protein [Acidobacteriota bacterium]
MNPVFRYLAPIFLLLAVSCSQSPKVPHFARGLNVSVDRPITLVCQYGEQSYGTMAFPNLEFFAQEYAIFLDAYKDHRQYTAKSGIVVHADLIEGFMVRHKGVLLYSEGNVDSIMEMEFD